MVGARYKVNRQKSISFLHTSNKQWVERLKKYKLVVDRMSGG